MEPTDYATGTALGDAKIVLAARDLLTKDGWGQGKYIDTDTGCRCSAGALIRIAADMEGPIEDLEKLESDPIRGLYKLFGRFDGPFGISAWNDYPGRTFDEVRNRFTEVAIELLEEAFETLLGPVKS